MKELVSPKMTSLTYLKIFIGQAIRQPYRALALDYQLLKSLSSYSKAQYMLKAS